MNYREVKNFGAKQKISCYEDKNFTSRKKMNLHENPCEINDRPTEKNINIQLDVKVEWLIVGEREAVLKNEK